MTSLAKKYDQSRLSARFALLIGLLMAGSMDGLLSPESLRTSPLALSYAIALAAMALSTLTFLLREARGYLTPGAPEPQTGPAWHEARLFTDPWYQIPAIYCVFVLACKLVVELTEKPPASDRAVWFLVFVAFMAVVLPISVSKRLDLEARDREDGLPGVRASAPTVSDAFRDPWFTVPAAVLAAVHIAGYGLEVIEEDPASPMATWIFLSPLLLMAFAVVMPSIDRLRRRRKKIREAAGHRSTGVTGEPFSSDAEA